MKTPRGLSGERLVRALQRLGYKPTRQVGSHLQLTTKRGGEHHISVPNHRSLKLGTLSVILSKVGRHFGMSRDEVLRALFSS